MVEIAEGTIGEAMANGRPPNRGCYQNNIGCKHDPWGLTEKVQFLSQANQTNPNDQYGKQKEGKHGNQIRGFLFDLFPCHGYQNQQEQV